MHSVLRSHEEIALGWLQLGVVGFGFGVVQSSLHTDHATIWTWEPGEGVACGYFTLSAVLMHSRYIMNVITRAVTRAEGIQLDFSTVRHGCCTDKGDEQRIKEAIRGSEDSIDHAIGILRTVGWFDQSVQMNAKNGMDPYRIRDGIGPFRVITACCAWSYWWITDLSSHSRHVTGAVLLFTICAVVLAVSYTVGGRSLFALDALYWSGIGHVGASILMARFRWHSIPLMEHDMSYYTAWLQVYAFSAFIIANVYHYRGYPGFCGRRLDQSIDEDSDLDDDSDKEDKGDEASAGSLEEGEHGSSTEDSSWNSTSDESSVEGPHRPFRFPQFKSLCTL